MKCPKCKQNLTSYEVESLREDGCILSGCPVTKTDSSGDFLLSAVIGAATGSALLGGLLGGDLMGGVVGDLLDGDLMD